jgi:tetratricopeptide (TPR) repeat protein
MLYGITRSCKGLLILIVTLFAFSTGWSQETIIKDAKAKLSSGDPAGAIELLKKGLKDYANTAEVHYWLGFAYFKNNQMDDAMSEALRTFELKPKYLLNRGLLLDLFLKKERYAEAQAECEFILAESKKDFSTRLKLAESYIGQKKFKEAAEVLAKLEFEQPQNVQVLVMSGKSYAKQRVNEEAIKYYTKALKIDPNSIDTRLELGKLYFRDQKYNEALKEYLEAVRLDSNNADANLNVGYIYFNGGKSNVQQYGFAIFYLQKYISLKPKDYEGYLYVGKSYHALRSYKNAIPYLEKAVELDTSKNRNEDLKLLAESYTYTNAYDKAVSSFEELVKNKYTFDSKNYILLGASYKALKDTVNTVKYFTKAVELDATQYERYYDIGAMFIAAKKYTEAASWFEKRLAISANDSNAALAWQQLGVCEFNSSKTRADSIKALVALRKATTLEPRSTSVWLTLGQISERLDSFDIAKDCYEKVLVVDTVNGIALFGRGMIAYNKDKKYEEAITYLQKAAKDDRFKVAYYVIAQCLVKQNKRRDAIEKLKKYLELDPNGPYAKFAKTQLQKLQQ